MRLIAGTSAQAVILTGEGKVFSAGADLDEARAGLAHAIRCGNGCRRAIAALALPDHRRAERHAGGRRDGHGAGLRSAAGGAGGEVLLSGDEAGLSAATVGSGAAGGAGRACAGQDDPDGGGEDRGRLRRWPGGWLTGWSSRERCWRRPGVGGGCAGGQGGPCGGDQGDDLGPLCGCQRDACGSQVSATGWAGPHGAAAAGQQRYGA